MGGSLRVPSIRQDPCINPYPTQALEETSEGKKGYYLSPVEWGKPEELGIEYARQSEGVGAMMEEQEAVSQVEAQ